MKLEAYGVVTSIHSTSTKSAYGDSSDDYWTIEFDQPGPVRGYLTVSGQFLAAPDIHTRFRATLIEMVDKLSSS